MLYLLNSIFEKDCTKGEIIEIFEKLNIKMTRPLITNYINQYIQNGIEIKSKTNNKREKVYFFEKGKMNLELNEEEFKVISDVKKLLISQKNYDRIRKTMRLFYKLSNFIEDKETKLRLIDFGYYSTINWNLVLQLEKHCENKDLILIDYILPIGKNKLIEISADRLKISTWSQRLYLQGALFGAKRFSHLPVDRIFMVKKVIKKNNQSNTIQDTLIYSVSKNIYNKLFTDEKEKVIKIEKDKITVERPLDDEFYIIQRLLYFCPEIYYISDERIKNLLKEKLHLIKAIYESKIDR